MSLSWACIHKQTNKINRLVYRVAAQLKIQTQDESSKMRLSNAVWGLHLVERTEGGDVRVWRLVQHQQLEGDGGAGDHHDDDHRHQHSDVVLVTSFESFSVLSQLHLPLLSLLLRPLQVLQLLPGERRWRVRVLETGFKTGKKFECCMVTILINQRELTISKSEKCSPPQSPPLWFGS